MIRKSTNESGFGAIGIISLSVVLVIVAAAGITIYKQHMNMFTKNTAHANSVATAYLSQTPASSASTTAAQLPQNTTDYFDIKEWGVKAPNSSSDTFAYNLSRDKKSVTVTSKRLGDKDASCANGGAGIIERLAPTDTVSPYGGTTVQQDAQQHPGTYVHVGGYYYLFVHAQSACGSVSIADQDQANAVVKASLAHLQTESN